MWDQPWVHHVSLRCCERDNPWFLSTSRVSMNDDLLLPYAKRHGSAHSHRHIRDCQSVVHGNVTYEIWPSKLTRKTGSIHSTRRRWTIQEHSPAACRWCKHTMDHQLFGNTKYKNAHEHSHTHTHTLIHGHRPTALDIRLNKWFAETHFPRVL